MDQYLAVFVYSFVIGNAACETLTPFIAFMKQLNVPWQDYTVSAPIHQRIYDMPRGSEWPSRHFHIAPSSWRNIGET